MKVLRTQTGEFCVYCGREMQDVEELSSLHDRTTGERKVEVWRQCPRWPRNGFVWLFRGIHKSYQVGGLRERRYG